MEMPVTSYPAGVNTLSMRTFSRVSVSNLLSINKPSDISIGLSIAVGSAERIVRDLPETFSRSIRSRVRQALSLIQSSRITWATLFHFETTHSLLSEKITAVGLRPLKKLVCPNNGTKSSWTELPQKAPSRTETTAGLLTSVRKRIFAATSIANANVSGALTLIA